LPSQFSLLELERQFIDVTVEVTDNQRIQTRILKDVRLNYLTNPDSALVLQNTTRLPRSLNIYVSGPAGVLEQLDASELMALCDLTAFSMPGPQDVPIQVMNLPSDVKVTRMLPHSPIRVILGAPSAP
jgi:YbbR domain-containing protein